jgi:membrane-associated phospholipid phosphatase
MVHFLVFSAIFIPSNTLIVIMGILKQKIWFFIPFVFLVALSFRIIALVPKGDLHLAMNHFHTGFLDLFFRLVTWLGDGLTVIILCVILLFFSFRLSAYILTTYAITGVFVQLLKRLFFEDVLRPAGYFKDSAALYLVEGVKIYYGHSFPSGHAATAFGVFLCLAMVSKNKILPFGCLVLALLTAYSRVYLSQHFLLDIVVGALIGVTGSLALYPCFYGNEKKWHQLSLLSLKKK